MRFVNSGVLIASPFLFFVPVDMLNGVLLRMGFPSVAFLYKAIVLIVVAVFLTTRGREIFVVAAASILILYLVVHALMFDDVSSAFSSSIFLVRFISTIVFSVFFVQLIKLDEGFCLFKIARFSFAFLVLNTLIGSLGFGSGMYGGNSENSIGTRGLIYAGNELGVALIVAAAIVMMQYLENRRYLYFSATGFVLMASSAVMASKTLLLASVLITLGFPLLHVFSGSKAGWLVRKSSIYFSIFALLFFGFLGTLSVFAALYYTGLMDRILFFSDKMGAVSILLSSRNIWFSEAYFHAINSYSLLEYIFGSGNQWTMFISARKSVEIDPVDFFMFYGVIGLFLLFGFILLNLCRAYMSRFVNDYGLYVVFMIALLLGISGSAGHVFNSGTAGFLVAILFSLAHWRSRPVMGMRG